MPLTQQQAHSAVGQNALLHGKTLFVIPATDSDHIALPLFTQSIGGYFCGHALLVERPKLALIVHFDEFLAAGCWVVTEYQTWLDGQLSEAKWEPALEGIWGGTGA